MRPRLPKRSSPGKLKIAAQAIVPGLSDAAEGDERFADPEVCTVSVELPVLVDAPSETDDGAKVQVAFCGRPLQESCNVPEKPSAAVNVSASVALEFCPTVSVEVAMLTTRAAAADEVDPLKFPSPPY